MSNVQQQRKGTRLPLPAAARASRQAGLFCTAQGGREEMRAVMWSAHVMASLILHCCCTYGLKSG